MAWQRGANPFAGASQEPMRLLESISPTQLASCVPFIKITKIEKFGRPATDVRPLMYDLVQTPQFTVTQRFGIDKDTFMERALVSLQSVNVDFKLYYGQQLFREVELEFIIHQPSVVFDRHSKVAWREIMEEGKSFALEYGWSADQNLVPNELFNGTGTTTHKGLVIKGTQSILLTIYSYTLSTTRTGEVKVTVRAAENGDLALRESSFSDAFERAFTPSKPEADDQANVTKLKALLDGIVKQAEPGIGSYYVMGDLLDKVLAPMITNAAANFGYVGQGRGVQAELFGKVITIPPSPAVLLLGDFNSDAGPQAKNYGSKPMAGHSIADFRVPVSVMNSFLSRHFAKGRLLFLKNFIDTVINFMNGEDAWAHPPEGIEYRQPNILLKSDTVKNADGSYMLVIVVYDVKTGTDPFHNTDRLRPDEQSRANIMARLSSLDIPVLEFGKAGSLILESSFELQLDTRLQGMQMDGAYSDRKTREQMTKTTDVQSRVGQARSGELIIPVSIIEGNVTTQGNFALEAFGLLWLDYYGASDISGVFHVIGKTDRIEAGKFTSTFKLISEGLDPLNTRRKKTDEEFADDKARADEVRKKKPKPPGTRKK